MFKHRFKTLAAIAFLSFLLASSCAGADVPSDSVDAPVRFEARVKASNAKWYNSFGQSVAVSGDTMVVGTAFEHSRATGVNGNQQDNGGGFVGAAYVFVRDGTNWVQQAYLKASNTGELHFAWGVAISGDTIVVGAPWESSRASGVNGNQNDTSLSHSGAAYVFVREGTNWSQQAYLKASNPGLGHSFGESVSISGDTIVVGARFESVTASAGAAYVFVRNGTNWSQQAYLKASNNDNCCFPHADLFGTSVSISGDTVVVGAPGEDSSASGVNGNQNDNASPNSGAAYVFLREGTNWLQQAYLKASNNDNCCHPPTDLFGTSVAISHDTIVVAAPWEDSSSVGVNGNENNNEGPNSGAVYVFVRDGINWTQEAYLKASKASWHGFGQYTSVSGDTIVVGSPGEDNSDQNGPNGAAYVFARQGAIWSQFAYLKPLRTPYYEGFGTVAISGNTIVVGARGEDTAAGSAYVFTAIDLPPSDSDSDGVPDPDDQCPNTSAGTIVDATGCSIEQLVPCEGPWRNHGHFLRALRDVTSDFLAAGLITRAQERAILLAGAQSDCGKRPLHSAPPLRQGARAVRR